MRSKTLTGVVLLLVVSACGPRDNDSLHVAVAANFAEPAREIADLFSETAGVTVRLSFGSTGQLYSQIRQDAPFAVFLSADRETPARIVSEGLGIEESVFTYAVGTLVLYSPSMDLTDGKAVLQEGAFERIAVANPVTAPYGRAAREAIRALGLEESLQPKIVEGNNVTQAFQFVATGNAALGFVASSQVADAGSTSRWNVPEALHSPIRQDAVLLAQGAEDAAARAFAEFLGSPEAAGVIGRYGYRTGP